MAPVTTEEPNTTTTLPIVASFDSYKARHDGAMWIWTVVFALSVVPNGVIAVIQESMFEDAEDLEPILVLFWSNLYTLFGYLIAVPLTMLPYLGAMV